MATLMIRFARPDEGPKATAIWREAAAWLIAREQPMWSIEQFDDNAAIDLARDGHLVIGFDGDDAVAAMTLQEDDPVFWPEAASSTALYLHKLAVRRDHSGRGWAHRMIEWACAKALGRGLRFVRLDCAPRPPLKRLYETCGFAPVDDGPLLILRHEAVRYARDLCPP